MTRRLCGVQAQIASAAALTIAVRQRSPKRGDVDRAVRARTRVKTWAMRGTLHLLPADEAAIYIASLSRLQPWLAKAWERYHGVSPADVERAIDALGEVLGDEPMGREQLVVEVSSRIRSKAAQGKLGSGWAELLKPAAWAGVLMQGPPLPARALAEEIDRMQRL